MLLCEIEGRGWTVPSGRVEPDECSSDAAAREAAEEAGARLADLQYIGSYRIVEKGAVRWADCFTARVVDLQEITAKAESKGRQFVRAEDLPGVYHVWNELFEQVFAHSKEVLERALA